MSSLTAGAAHEGLATAQWALVVSILSACLALGALTWQIALFRLSGGRIRVRLELGELEPYAGTAMIRHRTHRRARRVGDPEAAGRDDGVGMECARVSVENRGRTAVSLDGVGLKFDGMTTSDYRVTPRTFALKDFGGNEGQTDTLARLEPFSRITFWFDFWSILEKGLVPERRTRTVRMRAYARVAGQDRETTSEKEWSFHPDDVSSHENFKEVPVEDIIMRELIRNGWNSREDRDLPLDSGFARITAQLLSPDLSLEQVKELMQETSSRFALRDGAGTALIAHLVYRRLHEPVAGTVRWQNSCPWQSSA